ncbi:MAG: extracellular solute-binding protein [Anaerolineales bacterium]|nr:extracellular solute-binding protein [Anaerolineales bacterium]
MKKYRRPFSRDAISRRDFIRLTGGAIGAAILASCQEATPEPTEAPPPAEGELAYKGTLDVWDWEYPARENLVNELIVDWQAMHPDIPINYLPLPWADIETKILAVGTAGDAPPISDVYYGWRYDLQRAEVIAPYPEDFVDWEERISTPFMKDDEGRIRAFPSGWFVDMIYYNTELFEQEGLTGEDIPKSWDDFFKLADQLTQRDAGGTVLVAGCGMNDYWQHEYLWQDLIYQLGGWMYNEDGTEALWEEDPSVEALQFIQDWYFKHNIDSRDLPEGYGSFCNDLAVMFLGSGWNHGFFMADFPDMEGRWDTAPLPTFTGEPLPSYGIASPEENFQVFSQHPADIQEASFAFINHLMVGEDRDVRWTVAQGSAPDAKGMLDDPRILEIPGVRSQAETMEYRVCFGERPIEAEKYWRTMFDEVTLEEGDVREALHTATHAINEDLPTKKRYFTERNYSPPA